MSTYALNPDLDNYCVMGNPVAHSKSPQIHAEFARQTGEAIFYQAIFVEQDGFAEAVTAFRNAGGKGINVTVPFKEEACNVADKLTPRAEHAGAVNTLWFSENGDACYGDTTDGIGLVRDLIFNLGLELAGKDILIMGAGGAVRGILEPLLAESPARVLIANRTISRAEELVQDYRGRADISASNYQDLKGQQFALLINGTSLGLKGEIPPLPDDILQDKASCYDLVYASSDTPFVSWAKAHGAVQAVDGTGMLVEQAAESFHIWRGVRPETATVIRMLREGRG